MIIYTYYLTKSFHFGLGEKNSFNFTDVGLYL